MDFQQKRTFKRVLYSKITLLILLVIIFFLGRAVYNVYQKERFSRENLAMINEKQAGLLDRKSFLDDQIERLKTDEGVEAEIRNKFSVIKPGEVSVVIVDRTSSSKENIKENIRKTVWQSFLDLFR